MTFFFSSYSKFQFILKRWIWLSIICSWFDVRSFGKSFADLRLCNGGHILAVGPSQLVFLRKDNFHFHVFRRTFKILYSWFLFLQYLVFWYFWTRTISSFPLSRMWSKDWQCCIYFVSLSILQLSAVPDLHENSWELRVYWRSSSGSLAIPLQRQTCKRRRM